MLKDNSNDYLKGNYSNQRGAILAEYLWAVVLVAMICLSAVTFIGLRLNTSLEDSSTTVGNLLE